MEEGLKDARSERYAVGEQVLILMREFLGDNQKKADYVARVNLLRAFIKDPTVVLDDERLKEINTLLKTLSETLKQDINRQEFLKKQLEILLFSRTDISSLPTDVMKARIFPHLSLRELENYASSSEDARAQVDAYYEFLFTQAPLSGARLKLFQLIHAQDIDALKSFLRDETNQELLCDISIFDPIGQFDPLLYLKINKRQGMLDLLYQWMEYWIGQSPNKQDIILARIRTNQANQKYDYSAVGILSTLSNRTKESVKWIREVLLPAAILYEDRKAVDVIFSYAGYTLHEFIEKDDVETIQKLDKMGVGLRVRIYLSGAPSHLWVFDYAFLRRANAVAKYLVDRNMMEINHALVLVCVRRNIEMLRYLCEKVRSNGGPESYLMNGNNPALVHACQWGSVEAVKLLLELGFSPTVTVGAECKNALMCAASLLDHAAALEIATLLLTQEATRRAINKNGWDGIFVSPNGQDDLSALKVAKTVGNQKLVQLLLSYGAIPNAGVNIDKEGLKTVLGRYLQNNPKHKIARRLESILRGDEGVTALTLGEQMYLGFAKFFGTQLGKIYASSLRFIYPDQKDAASEGEAPEEEPLLPSAVATTSSSRKVLEQVGWVREMFEGPEEQLVVEEKQEFEGESAFWERRTPPQSPQLQHHGNNPENINNDNNAHNGPQREVQTFDAFLDETARLG